MIGPTDRHELREGLQHLTESLQIIIEFIRELSFNSKRKSCFLYLRAIVNSILQFAFVQWSLGWFQQCPPISRWTRNMLKKRLKFVKLKDPTKIQHVTFEVNYLRTRPCIQGPCLWYLTSWKALRSPYDNPWGQAQVQPDERKLLINGK